MRIGFVPTFLRGPEAALTRRVQQLFREAGHDCFVLESDERTQGPEADEQVPAPAGGPSDEYAEWALRNGLRAVFAFGEKRFDAVAAMKRSGVVTIGAFAWDRFSDEDVGPARAAFDCIYALHHAEVERYARMGLLAPRIHWGAPVELVASGVEARTPYAPVVFLYAAPGPEQLATVTLTVRAFAKADLPHARLVVRPAAPIAESDRLHPSGVSWRCEPMARVEEAELLRSADVLLVNARRDGLPLAVFDAIGAGLPLICPAASPWSEHVRHGLTGLALECSAKAKSPGGIPDVDVPARAITDAVRRLADRRVVEAMARNTQDLRDADYAWARTRADYLHLLDFAVSRRS